MEVDRRVVVGTFDNENEAASEVRRLKDAGYPKNKITLYTNADKVTALQQSQKLDVDVDTEATVERSADEAEDRSFWQQVKDAFSTETYDYDDAAQDPSYTRDDDVLYPYRSDIAAGKIVIVVEDYREDTDTNETVNRTETTVRESDDDLTEEERIRLREERLQVDKEEVQTGEVNVRKETVHDTETVDVPVEREEVVIERKPVVGKDAEVTDEEIGEDSESYTIPVKEEQVEVTKKPVVTEEVEIRKERKEDVEEVTEDVKREELEVERDVETDIVDGDLDHPDTLNTDLDADRRRDL